MSMIKNNLYMNHQQNDQHQRSALLTIADRGSPGQLFKFLQAYHRKPFRAIKEVLSYNGVIDDEIGFINCIGTKYNVTPLIIVVGKGSYEKAKILLVHGADPNKQCSTGDTALNLAVHRQKYTIADLLLKYNSNPNLYNQARKTALHRAVSSYNLANIAGVQALLDAGADPYIEDRRHRIPLDEAVIANKPEFVDLLLSYDQRQISYAYRSAILACHLGYDKCLEVLLRFGLNPNICDQTNTTPLHVAVRSSKLSCVQLLLFHGADRNIPNSQGDTPLSIGQMLRTTESEHIMNALTQSFSTTINRTDIIPIENQASNGYVLLRNHSNWTLDDDEYRSSTAPNSSIQNLLDDRNETFWQCMEARNAWVIFDFKHEYNINGIRIIGSNNASAPRNLQLDISNTLYGPWLTVQRFTCLLADENGNDIFFPAFETRFMRLFILDNYGGQDIQIQSIQFFGIDMRLVHLLKAHQLEKSLPLLLSNGINDEETFHEKQDDILNSGDKYLHVNDYFQFIHLIESFKKPQLTYLNWFDPPETKIIAGDTLGTFSVVGDEGLSNRLQIEQQLEQSSETVITLLKDLEPVQGCSLAEFSNYTIKNAGRYRIRVSSVEYPHIHTPWQEIVVGKKPREITIRETEGPYIHTSGFIAPIKHFTPTTDTTDEITGRDSSNTPNNFRYFSDFDTPRLFENNEENSEHTQMSRIKEHNRDRSLSNTVKDQIDRGTQINGASMRSIGTMCDTIQKSNFGNDTQPQSTGTQTSPYDNNKHPQHYYGINRIPNRSPLNDNIRENGNSLTLSTPPNKTNADAKRNPNNQKNQVDKNEQVEKPIQRNASTTTSFNKGYENPSNEKLPPAPPIKIHPIKPPRKPSVSSNGNDTNGISELDKSSSNENENQIIKLPERNSIIYPNTNVYDQRQSTNHTKPTDTYDRTGKINESPYHHAQQNHIPFPNDSAILNIGSENIVNPSTFDEFTVPFERRYVYVPNEQFALETGDISPSKIRPTNSKNDNRKTILLSVLNSSRTHIFEKQPITENSVRQSRENGNFYLAPMIRQNKSSNSADDTVADNN